MDVLDIPNANIGDVIVSNRETSNAGCNFIREGKFQYELAVMSLEETG